MFALYGSLVIFFTFSLVALCAEKKSKKVEEKEKEIDEISVLQKQIDELMAENEVLKQQAFELAVRNKAERRAKQEAQEEKNIARRELNATQREWEETLEKNEDMRASLKKHQQAVKMFLELAENFEDIKYYLDPEGYKTALYK